MKTKQHTKLIKPTIISIIILSIISIIIGLATSLAILESFRIIFGSIYVLFLPGFIISFLFFPKTKPFEESKKKDKEKGAVDWIERIALSFALSIAIVPLTVFYLNLIGVRINFLNSFLTILGIIAVSFGIMHWQIKRKKKN